MLTLVQEKLAHPVQATTNIRLLEPPVPVPSLVVTMFWSPVNDADPAHAWLRATLADVGREC